MDSVYGLQKNNYISDTSKLYRNVCIKESSIYEYASIGDETSIISSIISSKCEIGRRNILINSSIGFASYTADNTAIRNTEIGKYCSISWNVSIGGAQHPMESPSTFDSYRYRKIFGTDIVIDDYTDNLSKIRTSIGNDCWIGNGAIINGGLKLGHGCVIGCGSIVTHDVPDYAIVVGQPARILRFRFDEDIIECLLKTEWWNWDRNTIKNNISLLSSKINKDTIKKMEEIKRKIDK